MSMSQRLWTIFLLICKGFWKVLLRSWLNVGYGAGRERIAVGINEHKILRNEVMNETEIPVALAGAFMT